MCGRLRDASPISWSAGLGMVGPGDSLEVCLARADVELYDEKDRKKTRRGYQEQPAAGTGRIAD